MPDQWQYRAVVPRKNALASLHEKSNRVSGTSWYSQQAMKVRTKEEHRITVRVKKTSKGRQLSLVINQLLLLNNPHQNSVV